MKIIIADILKRFLVLRKKILKLFDNRHGILNILAIQLSFLVGNL
ncbi:MAG: hypothetical protein ACFFGZ_01730 [Candidatus Thorarchaeota archaeon]